MRTTLVLLLALLGTALALPKIVVKGNKFFNNETGTQFFVKGLDYAPSTDPLADTTSLKRDIAKFQELGINTVRIYSSKGGADHSEGLGLLDAAGIYVVIDVTDPEYSIVSDDPTWTLDLFNSITTKMTPFFKATNLLAFIAGNEVINNVNQTLAAPFVKAAVRDVKAYIKSQGYTIPVGYAGTDGKDFTVALQNYLNCGSDNTSVDFYGLNIYRWCGSKTTYEDSGYPTLTAEYGNYSRPFVFTEYGCNSESPRVFNEVQAIYGNSNLLPWLSGGFAFEYNNHTNSFGLLRINTDNTLTEFPDFTNLANQLKGVNPTGAKLSDPVSVQPYLYTCPATNPSNFLAETSTLPPSPNSASCECMVAALQCVVAPSATPSAIQNATGFVCGDNPSSCAGVDTDSASGTYGAWSGCNSIQRASYIFNAYYQKFKTAQSCQFNGAGKIQTATGTVASCLKAGTGSSSSTTSTFTTSTFTTSTFTTSTFTSPSTSTNNDVRPSTTAQMTGSATGVVPVMVTVFALLFVMMI